MSADNDKRILTAPPSEVADILEQYNIWRRDGGSDIPCSGRRLGYYIDRAVQLLRKIGGNT